MPNSPNLKYPPTKFECTITLKLAFAVLTTVNAKTSYFKKNILMLSMAVFAVCIKTPYGTGM